MKMKTDAHSSKAGENVQKSTNATSGKYLHILGRPADALHTLIPKKSSF